ncbi:MAG TPA: GNAT family N-acetyltransferase [Solirubrobacteraceae bacterium]|nr:GNAT family N-acetyltransferase [Solirubrobacteraceae bacterium]
MIQFQEGRVDAGDGGRLESAMRDEVGNIYAGLDLQAPDMPKAGPEQLNAPAGSFIVGYEHGVAICCGGIKRLDTESCELKRMYVIPEQRGRGVARVLLLALEDRARELGYVIARLDTGPKQQGAQRLYESAGYAAIPNFNGNPVASFFGEKRL